MTFLEIRDFVGFQPIDRGKATKIIEQIGCKYDSLKNTYFNSEISPMQYQRRRNAVARSLVAS